MGASATPYSSGICDESTPGKHEDGYRGCQTKTVSGNTCQKWTVQRYPGQHTRTPGNYPGKGLGDHNNCRNPDDEPNGIWCYTTNPNKRWEYCDPVHHTHAEYLAHLAAHEDAAADAADEIAEHKADKVTARTEAERIANEHGDAIQAASTEAERIANEHGDAIQDHEDAATDAAAEIAKHEAAATAAAAEIAQHKADKVTASTEAERIANEHGDAIEDLTEAHEVAAATKARQYQADKVKRFLSERKKEHRIANEHGRAINDLNDEIAEHEEDKATARTEVARIAQELRTIAGYPEQLRTIAGEVANLIPEDDAPCPCPPGGESISCCGRRFMF